MPRLKSVDLSHNKIRHFHSDSFISTPLVDELKLSHNGLTEVSDVSFVMDALPKLRLLDLSDNDIRDIPFGALRGNFFILKPNYFKKQCSSSSFLLT